MPLTLTLTLTLTLNLTLIYLKDNKIIISLSEEESNSHAEPEVHSSSRRLLIMEDEDSFLEEDFEEAPMSSIKQGRERGVGLGLDPDQTGLFSEPQSHIITSPPRLEADSDHVAHLIPEGSYFSGRKREKKRNPRFVTNDHAVEHEKDRKKRKEKRQ